MRAPRLDGLLSFAVGAALAVAVMRLAPPARAHLAPLLKVVRDARRYLGASVHGMHANERRSERQADTAESPSLTAPTPSPSMGATLARSPSPSMGATAAAAPKASPTADPVADLDGQRRAP